MLLGGDEIARTQGGNNNGWCQDSEISWFDWSLVEKNAELLAFSKRVIALRRAHAVFRRREFLFGREVEGSGLPDAAWFRADGDRMTSEDWSGSPAVVGLFLNGEEIASPDARGRQILDESFLLLFNGSHEDHSFSVPDGIYGDSWSVVLDTSRPEIEPGDETLAAGEEVELVHHSLVLLRREQP
jgi:isoamylase